jgi:hypothetical protein
MARRRSPKFIKEATQSVYSSSYRDTAGNRWLLNLSGQGRSVRYLLDKSDTIVLAAEGLSQGEAKEAFDQMKKDYRRAARRYPEPPPKPPLNVDLPVRKLKANLELLKTPGPYRLDFTFDPPLDAGHPFDSYSLGLGQANLQGSISCAANGGQVELSAEGPGSVVSNGVNALLIRSDVQAVWRIVVRWVSGAPTYTLSGALIIL